MKINIPYPQIFFAAFYILSFTVILVLAIYFARTRKLPLRSVLLMLTATTLFTIAGSRLFTIPISQWGQIFISGKTGEGIGRSAIGGIIFGLAGFILSSGYARLDMKVFEFYAWLTPVGYGIQKLGCFFNGCCYGIQAGSLPGVRYPIGANAHFAQFASGAIDINSAYSLKVFPVQLIEVILFLLTGYIVWRAGRRLKKTGSIILFSFMMIFGFRFFTEFLRDPSYSQLAGNFMGIRLLQWFLLLMGILSGTLLFIYEKLIKRDIKLWKPEEMQVNRSLLFIMSLTAGIFMFRGILAEYEKISLYIVFVPSVFLTGLFIVRSAEKINVRLAATSSLVLPLFMIYPTMSGDTLKNTKRSDLFYQNEPGKYKRVDLGASIGSYNSTLYYNPQEGECGTYYTTEDYEHKIGLFGGGYSAVTNEGDHLITKGINIFGGDINEKNLTLGWSKSYFICGINPYIKYDAKWYGAGIGVNVGNLRWIVQHHVDASEFDHGMRFSPVMPEVLVRVGRSDIIDLRYNFGFNSYATYPILISELSIGTGFGQRTDFGLRGGVRISEMNLSYFLSGEFTINKKVGVTFKYDFGNTEYDTNSDSWGNLVIGTNFRF